MNFSSEDSNAAGEPSLEGFSNVAGGSAFNSTQESSDKYKLFYNRSNSTDLQSFEFPKIIEISKFRDPTRARSHDDVIDSRKVRRLSGDGTYSGQNLSVKTELSRDDGSTELSNLTIDKSAEVSRKSRKRPLGDGSRTNSSDHPRKKEKVSEHHVEDFSRLLEMFQNLTTSTNYTTTHQTCSPNEGSKTSPASTSVKRKFSKASDHQEVQKKRRDMQTGSILTPVRPDTTGQSIQTRLNLVEQSCISTGNFISCSNPYCSARNTPSLQDQENLYRTLEEQDVNPLFEKYEKGMNCCWQPYVNFRKV